MCGRELSLPSSQKPSTYLCLRVFEKKSFEKRKEMILTDDDYNFNEGHEVVLKIPMMAQVVPDMDKHEFGEGMNLTPSWTDGETYVDLMTEDGWTVRFEIDISKWPRKVNGIPEDECFEELFYAG